MVDFDIDALLDDVKDTLESESKDLLEEWKPVLIKMGKDKFSDLIELIKGDNDDEAVDIVVDNDLSGEDLVALIGEATDEMDAAKKKREKAYEMIDAFKSSLKSIGGAVLKTALGSVL